MDCRRLIEGVCISTTSFLFWGVTAVEDIVLTAPPDLKASGSGLDSGGSRFDGGVNGRASGCGIAGCDRCEECSTAGRRAYEDWVERGNELLSGAWVAEG